MKKPTLRHKCRCDPSFACRHKPLQPVTPSFSQPNGQSPHVLLPSVLVHLRLLSHPPLLLRHSSTSKHKSVHAYTVARKIKSALHTQIKSNKTRTANLCNQSCHHCPNQMDICCMFCHLPCCCISACCRIRHYSSGTRSRLHHTSVGMYVIGLHACALNHQTVT